MIRYVGLDVHKQFMEVCLIDRKGKVLARSRVDCRRDELERFAAKELRKTDRVALEATTNTWPIVDILRPHVTQLVVGNPLKTKAIAEAKVKTDKVDAEVLAQLLRCEYLPEVWQPDEATQVQRSLLTHRMGLTRQRTRHKNHIQSVLNRLMCKVPCRCLWTKMGLAWLKAQKLPPKEMPSHHLIPTEVEIKGMTANPPESVRIVPRGPFEVIAARGIRETHCEQLGALSDPNTTQL